MLTTDTGSVEQLRDLNPTGQERLREYIRMISDSRRNHDGEIPAGVGVEFQRYHFNDGRAVQRLSIETTKKTGETGVLLTTMDMTDQVKWRRGSLRVKDIEIPETIKSSLKGRKVEEVVKGTPFGRFEITSVVIDKRSNGSSLRLCCTGKEQLPLPYQK